MQAPGFWSALVHHGYNLPMPRAALFALLVASTLSCPIYAQRVAASFHGGGFGGRSSVRSGFIGHRAFSHGFFSGRSHIHQDGLGSAFFPYDEPFDYAQTDGEAMTKETAPVPLILRRDERLPGEQAPPASKPLIIEIPAAANSTVPKMPPPTIFILENGERVETRRFLLTANVLSFSLDRQQRIVPFDMLNINATISANRDRGIDLRIPADPNEISLSF